MAYATNGKEKADVTQHKELSVLGMLLLIALPVC